MSIKKEDFVKKEDEYYPEPTYVKEYPGGPTVKWFSPIITPEERERRMNDLKKQTEKFMRVVLEIEARKEQEKNEKKLQGDMELPHEQDCKPKAKKSGR